MNNELCYYYCWEKIADELKARVLREFLDLGVSRFVFTINLLKRSLESQDYIKFLHKLEKDMSVEFVAMHGICGPSGDLDFSEPELRKKIISDHKRAIEIAAEFGSKTYTVHVGAAEYKKPESTLEILKERTIDSLEQILPTAEKNGVIIAVENAFEPPNTPMMVMQIIKHFNGNKNIGACFDTGHANMMTSAPWKKYEEYPDYQQKMWARTGIITTDDAIEQMQSSIVTVHMHDNDGYCDLHGMPFDGNIDWSVLMPKIRACKNLLEYQTEVCLDDGINWAGKLLAPIGGYSINKLVSSFKKLGF